MRYEESIELLESLYMERQQPSRVVGLSRAVRLLADVGSPLPAFRSIHVAGSSGKGSTSTMIATIMRNGGYRTGLFRSPHLIEYAERIMVNEEEISHEEWMDHFQRVWPVVERMRTGAMSDYHFGRPSLFEVLFVLAALHFKQRRVEWAVVEAGMGGRLDATNTLTPDVSVVTNVSLEHTTILGNTEAKIAVEKAAIIKHGGSAVTAAHGDALGVIRRRARQVNAPLLEVPRDIRSEIESASLRAQTIVIEGETMRVRAALPLGGAFQATNAATACGAVESLRDRGVRVDESAIKSGLESVAIPGRMEVVQTCPLIILDGAQSLAGCQELARALAGPNLPAHRVLIFAAMKDKDFVHMARVLGPVVHDVVVTCVPDTPRSADPEDVAAAFGDVCPHVIIDGSVASALHNGLGMVTEEDMIIVAGSLYLVGLMRRILNEMGVSS